MFYTNERKIEIDLKLSSMCVFWDREKHSVQHMLITCPVVPNFIWSEIENWLQNLGLSDNTISVEKKMLVRESILS